MQYFEILVSTLWEQGCWQITVEHFIKVVAIVLADLINCSALPAEKRFFTLVYGHERFQEVAADSFVYEATLRESRWGQVLSNYKL